ncbi:YbbR-like domain-containing protein [soil metagenome]
MEAPKEPENRIPKKSGAAGTSRNTAILLLCMGIAFFLWLLIKLSDNYTWHVPVTLVYSNLPDNRVPVRDLPTKSEVMVHTTGLKLILARFRIINITLPIPYKENKAHPYVLGRNLQNELASEMPPGYQLLGFSPDTIFLQFDKKVTKKVPVKLNGKVTYAKQYEGRPAPIFSPDSVMVSGPQSVIDTLRYWPTTAMDFENIKDDKSGKVKLQKPNYGSVSLDETAVGYQIDVESFTQITREITIEVINVPKGKKITAYPKKVKVYIHVGLSNLDAAKSVNISATVDFKDVNIKKDRFVEVKLSGYPEYMNINNFEPHNVEFIVYN